jgi:uncharacterized membrane protein YtjA (UPF0391 family)
VLGYALTFLILAFGAGLLGSSEISGVIGHITWLVLVMAFVLTLGVTVHRALNRVENLRGESR